MGGVGVEKTLNLGNTELTERTLSWQSLCWTNRTQLELNKIKSPPPGRVEVWGLSGGSCKHVALSWILKDGQDFSSQKIGERKHWLNNLWAVPQMDSEPLVVMLLQFVHLPLLLFVLLQAWTVSYFCMQKPKNVAQRLTDEYRNSTNNDNNACKDSSHSFYLLNVF